MIRITEIERALAAWREAELRLKNATDGDREALEREADRHRETFRQLSAEHMIERLDALHSAEEERHGNTPSTPEFHDAAKREMAIALDIWDAARMSDQDTPPGRQN
jgi:molecular chaperone GrpE (heat shock protein)